jgi:hypothetical protein
MGSLTKPHEPTSRYICDILTRRGYGGAGCAGTVITPALSSMIARPDETIEALNAHLNTKLTVDNLRAVYRGPLYKVPRNSPFEYAKAAMIYLKNYPERAST